jgi:hypothetical protein
MIGPKYCMAAFLTHFSPFVESRICEEESGCLASEYAKKSRISLKASTSVVTSKLIISGASSKHKRRRPHTSDLCINFLNVLKT